MANATSPAEFNADQAQTVRSLAFVLQVAAAVLLLAGAVRLGLGIYTLLYVANVGVLFIIEALPLLLLGLVLLAATKSTRYTVETKYAPLHLTHVFRDLAVYHQVLFYAAVFFSIIVAFWLLLA